jgi:hypothetical protein
VGFNWAVSDDVAITGTAYFALTTSCVMAGAGLSVVFSTGDLRAWFTAYCDALISWRPFFFTAQMGMTVGVDYSFSVLGVQKTISVSLSATALMWGPPTGGTVQVDLWVCAFTVAFGSAGASTADAPLAWSDFASLLPAAASVVTILPTNGITKMIDATDGSSTSGKTWYARAVGLTLSTQSAMPASQLSYGSTEQAHPADVAGDPVAIRPMNLSGVTAVHSLSVRQGEQSATPAPIEGWTLSPRQASVPDSLWGSPPAPFTQIPATPAANVLPGTLVGYDVSIPGPALGPSPGVIEIAAYAEEPLPSGTQPLDPVVAPSTDYVPAPDPTSVTFIAGIAAARPARDGLYAVLGAAGIYAGANDPLVELATNAGDEFGAAPMLEWTAT